MTTIAPSIMVSRYQQLGADLAGIGQALDSAAQSGGFDHVFAQINSDMQAIDNPAPTPAPASTPASAPGGSMLSSALGGTLLTTPSNMASGASLAAAAVPAPVGGTSPGAQVVADAERYLGVPYVWGGTSATGFDCSGLVQHVYGDLGVSLPRTSEEQATVGTAVPSLAQAQPGDLVFFAGTDGTASSPGHVGIYIGNGEMIDAPYTGASVRIDPAGQPVAIRRLLPAAPVGGSPMLAGYISPVTGSAPDAQMTALGVPVGLQSLFDSAGSRYGIDPLLLAAVAKQESGFDAQAVSGAGAQGLMQLMPATAAGLGVNPFDPAQAIDGAAQMLSGYLQRYGGSVPLSLSAYNAGPGAVASYGGVPPYAQTQSYVAGITSMLDSVS